jgi:hypothetical protein
LSAVGSETKLFTLNESVDLNTKRLCSLQDSNERAAGALQILQYIFAGILAFDILDRLTGNAWSVQDAAWAASFYAAILDTPLMWFLVSLFVWLIVCIVCYYTFRNSHYVKQGVTAVRLKINRKIFIPKIQDFLRTKVHSYEERQYDDNNDVVKITYTDKLKQDWGGAKPTITLEYDERNSYLLNVTVNYNRREAKKSLVFTAEELRAKIMTELNIMDVWDIKGEDKSNDDLAADKRAAVDRKMEEEEANAMAQAGVPTTTVRTY